MLKCKICKVHLDGFLGKIMKLFFNIRPSSENPKICNKCINKKEPKPTGKKYVCQICKKMVHEDCSIEHAKAEEYIMNLIKKDHPQWRQNAPMCEECVEYYRKLITEAEI